MAVNPITSDDLTIDLTELMKLSVSDRVQAAATDSSFVQALMQSLTPIQLAKAFPDYYRRELPDISNFILANRYLDKVGAGGFNQRGGGDYGTQQTMYGGEAVLDSNQRPAGVPEPTLDEMKAKLLEKGIDVSKTYNAISNGLSIDDPQVSFLKGISAEKLSSMGIEEYKDDAGKSMYRIKPVEAEIEDLKKTQSTAKPLGSVGNGLELPKERRKQIVFNAILQQLKDDGYEAKDIRGVAAMLAGQPEQESGYNPTAEHDKDRNGNPTGYGIYGARLDRRDDMFKWLADNGYEKDDLIGQARFMAHESLTKPEYRKYMDNMSNMDLTAMARENPNEFRQVMRGFTKGFEGPADVDAGLENRIRGAIDTFGMKEENVFKMNNLPTPEELTQRRKDIMAREVYGKASPTSSDYIVDSSEGKTTFSNVVEKQQEVAGVRKGPITSELRNSLSYAASQASDENYEVQVVVTSGGQRMEGAEGSTGSHRHDKGNAADLNAYLTDKRTKKKTLLDPRNPDHIPYISKLTTNFSRVHPNAGVGALYMDDPTKIHLGGDDVSEHGGRARGPLAYAGPQWFKESHALGVQQRKEDKKNNVNPLQTWLKEQEEARTKLAEENKKPTIAEHQENIPVATPEPIKSEDAQIASYQFGGTPTLQDDEDLTAVGSDGKPRFKFNSGEGLYVKPEANEYADDKINELSDRIDNLPQNQQQQSRRPEMTSSNQSDPNWVNKVASAYRPSGSQQRAFNRAQFRSEGRHVGDRGSPNIA